MTGTDGTETVLLEMRLYKLHPGTRSEFDRIFREGALPMLRRYGITVAGFGSSVIDDDGYFLLRAFPSVQARTEQLDSFYGSDEWKRDYEEPVLAMIEAYQTVVTEVSTAVMASLVGETSSDGPALHRRV